MVLIHDKGPRAKWKLGKIIRLYPGRDGVVRVVQLKTSRPIGLLNRPVVKLYPLELGSIIEPEISQDDVVSNERPTRRMAIATAQVRRRLVETGQL